MIEVFGNLWEYPADVRVITTNGFVKNNGLAVMGRGCALEAAKKYPQFPYYLGTRIKEHGLSVEQFGFDDGIVLAFPVKHNWYENADKDLIIKSTFQLIEIADKQHNPKWNVILMPRPGCGNGNLSWDGEVKPILEEILDDRFHVITFDKGQLLPARDPAK